MKSSLSLLMCMLILLLCSFAPDWLTVQSDEGRFRAMYPVAPVTDVDTARPEGRKIPWTSFMYSAPQGTDDNNIYGISYSDHPQVSSDSKDEKKIDDFLDHALSISVLGINGEIVKNEHITYKTFPGRFMKVSFAHGKAVMDLKILLVHSRCYILQVGYMLKKDGNPSIDRFFNSFELLGEK